MVVVVVFVSTVPSTIFNYAVSTADAQHHAFAIVVATVAVAVIIGEFSMGYGSILKWATSR